MGNVKICASVGGRPRAVSAAAVYIAKSIEVQWKQHTEQQLHCAEKHPRIRKVNPNENGFRSPFFAKKNCELLYNDKYTIWFKH